MIIVFTLIYHSHGDDLRFGTCYFQQSVTHDGSSGVNAQNYFLFNRLNHLITSIKVGNPTTLSLKTFIISSLSFIPCRVCQ